jgi:hypothetical protein
MSPDGMSKDEIRKLLGGYATGTLTDTERKALFDAALDDQELFDELGREQALKELLDVPGTRTRLAAALGPPAPAAPWWKKPLAWAMAGTVAVGLLGVFVVMRAPRTTEIAGYKDQSAVSQPPIGQPAASQPAASAATGEPAKPAPDALLRKQAVPEPEAARRDARNAPPGAPIAPPAPVPAPAAAAPPPAPIPEQDLKKEEAAVQTRTQTQAQEQAKTEAKSDTAGPAADRASANKALAGKAAEKLSKDAEVAEVREARPPVQTQAQVNQTQVPSGLGGREQQLAAERAAAGAPAAARLRSASVGGFVAQSRVAFDYTIGRDNLTVRPLAAGFLQVTVLPGGLQAGLRPFTRVDPGTPVSIAIPAGSATVTVELSANDPTALDSLSNAQSVVTQKAAKMAPKAKVSQTKAGHVEDTGFASITLAVPRK